MTELTWLELLSPDIVAPTGLLVGDITLGGTRGAPTLGGQARLTGFSAAIPALGIKPTDGTLTLDALPDATASINGSLRSGAGTLALDGSVGSRDEGAPLQVTAQGNDGRAPQH